MVYYDEEEEEPDQRWLTFFKGDLMAGGKDFHGNEMFYSAKEGRELYF